MRRISKEREDEKDSSKGREDEKDE